MAENSAESEGEGVVAGRGLLTRDDHAKGGWGGEGGVGTTAPQKRAQRPQPRGGHAPRLVPTASSVVGVVAEGGGGVRLGWAVRVTTGRPHPVLSPLGPLDDRGARSRATPHRPPPHATGERAGRGGTAHATARALQGGGGGGGGGWVGNGGRASGARPPPPARPACTTPPPCPCPAPPRCPSPRGRRQPPPRPPCLGCCLSSRLPAGHASWRPPPPPPTPTQRMQEGARRQWRGKREGATAREGARGGEHVSQKRPWWPRVSGASRGGPTQ